MIKTYHLYSTILYQSIPGRDLSVLIDTNREYLNAIFDVRTNARWLASLKQNPLASRYLLACPAIVGLVVDDKDIVDNILLHDDNYTAYLPEAAASPAAVTAIADSYMYSRIRSDPRYSDLYNPGSVESVVAALALILNLPDLAATHTTFEDVAGDADLIARIAANRQALVAVGSSEGAMVAIVANVTAMGILAGSQTAMDVLSVLTISRAAIINSAVAMTAVAGNRNATRALVDVSPLDVFAVPENVAMIEASDVGLDGLCDSASAIATVFVNPPLVDTLFVSARALAIFANNATALSAVFGDLDLSIAALRRGRFRLAVYESTITDAVLPPFSATIHTAIGFLGLTVYVTPNAAMNTIYTGKAVFFFGDTPGSGSGSPQVYVTHDGGALYISSGYFFHSLANTAAKHASGAAVRLHYFRADDSRDI